MRISFSIAVALLALAGCASSGPAIDNARLTGVQKDKTTADEVIRRLGQPSFNSNNLDGTRTIAYLEPGSRSDASAMVALVGAIASGATPNVNSVIFRFDANGRLAGYTRTTESFAENETARAGTITSGQPAAVTTPAATAKPAAATVTPQSPGTTAASAPAPAGTTAATGAAPAPATAAAPAASAPAKTAPKRQTRSDGLPDWLPSGNYDPRNPF